MRYPPYEELDTNTVYLLDSLQYAECYGNQVPRCSGTMRVKPLLSGAKRRSDLSEDRYVYEDQEQSCD